MLFRSELWQIPLPHGENNWQNICFLFVDNIFFTKNIKAIPILGEISAGQPLLAEENFIGEVTYIKENKNNSLFALKVNGDSMVDAGLFDNDLVIISR